jgi:hypothetical protein
MRHGKAFTIWSGKAVSYMKRGWCFCFCFLEALHPFESPFWLITLKGSVD